MGLAGAGSVTPAAPPAGAADWISIREASAMLGVSPATLRRWAEAGVVPAFTTPGGHRRFSRSAISARLPGARASRRNLAGLGTTTEGMAERYRRQAHGAAAAAPWLAAVPESSRELLREHGRAIAAALIGTVEATSERERAATLAGAMAAAADYGRLAAMLGASMRQTVATFLQFRRPFVEEMAAVARRGELDGAETAALLAVAGEAIDRLLDATLEAHEAASAEAAAAAFAGESAAPAEAAAPAEESAAPADAAADALAGARR